MNEVNFFRIRIYVTAAVATAIGSLLIWNYYHGGIPSHHILADKALPKISNLWGAVLLPLLTWFLLYQTQKRIFHEHDSHIELSVFKQVIYTFTLSLIYGIILSALFSYGYPDMTGNMMLGVFALAFFFPLYHSESLLGFVIGMTFTFGAVLPTGIGSILALITFVLFRGVRPAVLYVASRFSRT